MGLGDRLFRTLLTLLPQELRDPYRRDMEATFHAEQAEIRRNAGATGSARLRLGRLWVGVVADLLRTAPAEHLDILRRDLRVALRLMRARPLHTLTALLTLVIGVAANVAMFSVVDRVLLAPMPWRDPGAVVLVEETREGASGGTTGYLSFADVRDRARSFETLAGAVTSVATITGDGRDAERVSAMRVSHTFFDVLGVSPARGRTFSPAEDKPGGARQVVIISDAFRQRRYGASADVIGRPLLIGDLPFTIVGVMPSAFADLVSARMYAGAELWTPLGYDPTALFSCRTCRHVRVFGRLAPGVSREQAEAEVSRIYRDLERAHPADYRGAAARLSRLSDVFLGPVRPVLTVLWAGVGLLFIVACSNVANLLLLRGSERTQEMAVRTALGVTRGRLLRQLVTESALLSALAGLLALAPAWAAIRAVALYGPPEMPRIADVALDARAVAACLILSVVAGLLSGIVPIVRLSRSSAGSQAGAGRTTATAATWRLRATLVAASVAMAAVLLVGSGLLVRSLLGLLAVAPGFDPAGVVTMAVSLGGERYRSSDRAQTVARALGFYDEVLTRAAALPGVDGAGAVSTLPMDAKRDRMGFHVEGRFLANPAAAPNAHRFTVTPRFLQTMRIRLLRGRYLDERDGQTGEPVVVIGRQTAAELFAGEDPLGRRVALGPATAQLRTIVGVVEDVRHEGLHEPPGYQVYFPQAQWAWPEFPMTLVVRGRGDAGALTAALRQIVREVDPGQPVTSIRLYDDVVAETTGTRRFAAWLLGGFALAALVLAVVGLHGALGVAVGLRQREIGVRLALGARAGTIRAMVLRQGLLPAIAGLGAGLALAVVSVRALGTLLYGVPPSDPTTFIVATLTLGSCAVLACLVPAWRASRIDPVQALRSE